MENKKNLDGNEKEILRDGEVSATVPVQKNIETILDLEKETVQSRSIAEHFADRITTFAGSTPYIILHAVCMGGWILINLGIIPGIAPLDPFPFRLLTFVVLLESIFLTLLVLMSQNRMTKEADKRAHLNLQINMLNEQETTMILRMVQKMVRHFGLEEEIDGSLKELTEETDVNRVAKTFDEKSAE
ncbi:hypothetical protein C3K47_09410 [Solitalea longa]|uniref:DUF1003 domain-containing protein n=1 Tax=Solitalea longa TaxID=2079460 RepID=A0A2S5A391_9SPHI|nr:DUF1003 domain-containing protein [Solitalea longa]POY36583.1 hypothetical protein C3K47_09410 [Solitalea longa]